MQWALLILQAGAIAAASPQVAPAPLPTIEVKARVRADSIRIERQGETHLVVAAEPLLDRKINVRRNRPLPNGAIVRDFTVELDATATIAPLTSATPSATGNPKP